tara:strand:+ start:4887 stop:5891 length:1005 start_codon:yes stop_codon:yes gene_type:complete
MIKKGKFFIKNLKNVIFLGESDVFRDLIDINNKKGINSKIITSPAQSKNISVDLKFKKFAKIDSKFKKFINSNFKIDETLFISMGSRWIFSGNMIKNFFKNNLINFHPTRLPQNSGATPFSWQILRGDRISIRLIHLIEKEIDKGPIIYFDKSILPNSCQIPKDFYEYYNSNLVKFYEKFLDLIIKKHEFELKKQPNYLSNYNPRLNSNINGWIDWSLSSKNILRFINAFDDPYKGSITMMNKKKVRIKKVQLHGGETSNHPYSNALVLRNDEKWIVVGLNSERHTLLISEVLDTNNKNIVKNIKVGDRFYSPIKKLETAKRIRAKFKLQGIKK